MLALKSYILTIFHAVAARRVVDASLRKSVLLGTALIARIASGASAEHPPMGRQKEYNRSGDDRKKNLNL
jgi:hypothetical protein